MNELKSPWYERYRVRISFLYAALFLIYTHPKSVFLLLLGILIAAAGIFLRQWSAGHIKKMDEVSCTGPYAMVRHPLYVGSFLAALGLLVASLPSASRSYSYLIQTLFLWLLFFLLVRNIYIPKCKKEEENLTIKFGDSYLIYMKETPPFIPNNWSALKNFTETFQWDLWLKNQEYMSLIGFFLITFLLLSRYLHR